jgi:hypothetical protein
MTVRRLDESDRLLWVSMVGLAVRRNGAVNTGVLLGRC